MSKFQVAFSVWKAEKRKVEGRETGVINILRRFPREFRMEALYEVDNRDVVVTKTVWIDEIVKILLTESPEMFKDDNLQDIIKTLALVGAEIDSNAFISSVNALKTTSSDATFDSTSFRVNTGTITNNFGSGPKAPKAPKASTTVFTNGAVQTNTGTVNTYGFQPTSRSPNVYSNGQVQNNHGTVNIFKF